jgi:hypothetical protein
MKSILCIAALFLTTAMWGQNVGIGTTVPTSRLQINHRSTATATGLRLVDSAVNTGGSIEFRNIASARRMLLSGYSESNFNNGQYLDIQSDSMYVASFKGNGMVGIRNSTPVFPLDVTGDINTTGALRVNGNAGSGGQVLRSNGNGTMGWADVSEYKNFETFRYTTTGAVQNWTVPAGVTKIRVECWGGGGYGDYVDAAGSGESHGGGGGGGGYITGYFTVTPGSTVAIVVAYGGTDLAPIGGNSSVTVGTKILQALGGVHARTIPLSFEYKLGEGGGFTATGTTNYFGLQGQSGSPDLITFSSRSSTQYVRQIAFGNGGHAGSTTNTGGIGGTTINVVGTSTSFFKILGNDGAVPGGGGPALGPTASVGGFGGDGLVIVYY